MYEGGNCRQDSPGASSGQPCTPHALCGRLVTILVTLAVTLCVLAPLPSVAAAAPTEDSSVAAAASAEAPGASAQSSFTYQHEPIYNPTAMKDAVVNPDAVYGFSPNPDAGSLKEYAKYDWTDPEEVALRRAARFEYHEEAQQLFGEILLMYEQGASMEDLARFASARRNQNRLDSYEGDPDGLAKVKQHNMEKYGNESGPTPEWLYQKYGSWEAVLANAFNTNPGMDACCGLYDENWEMYVFFGQIPLHTVSYDAAGHGQAPAAEEVYAGEVPSRPNDPIEEGWTFGGWLVKESQEPYDFTAPVTGDMTLVAQWSEVATPADEKADEQADVSGNVPDAKADANQAASKPVASTSRVTSSNDNAVPRNGASTTESRRSVLPAAGDASVWTSAMAAVPASLLGATCCWRAASLRRRPARRLASRR